MKTITSMKELMRLVNTDQGLNEFVKSKSFDEFFDMLKELGHEIPRDWFLTTSHYLEMARDWYNRFKFVPKNPYLFMENTDSIKNLKLLRKAINRFLKENNSINATDMAVTANVALNNSNFETFLKLAKKAYGANDHDAMNLLYCWPGMGDIAIKLIKSGCDYDTVHRRIMSEFTFSAKIEAKDHDFAAEAKKWITNENDYYALEKRWMARCIECDLPNVKIQDGKYTLYLMDKNDPRGLFLGEYTVCCQHPSGAGEDAAWYGVEKRNAGFYVVEDNKGNILAQAFTWINGSGLVLDSVETIRKHNTDSIEMIVDMFSELAEHIQLHYGLTVRVGASYGTGAIKDLMVQVEYEDTIPIPKDLEYTDAEEQLAFCNEDEHMQDALTILKWKNDYEIEEIVNKYKLIPHTRELISHNYCYDSELNEYITVQKIPIPEVIATVNRNGWRKVFNLINNRSIYGDCYKDAITILNNFLLDLQTHKNEIKDMYDGIPF